MSVNKLLNAFFAVLAVFILFFAVTCADESKEGGIVDDDDADNSVIDGIRIGDNVADKGKLVWRDEFDGEELDTSKWNYDYGSGSQYGGSAGWGNNEKQWYLPRNVRVENGKLVIEALNDLSGAFPYSSGKITTKGTANHTGAVTYPAKAFMGVTTGFVEARIKAPRGAGFWPAFWMLSADVDQYSGYPAVGWPKSGEIDIFEMNGGRMERHSQTIHYGSLYPDQKWSKGTGGYNVPNMADDFHVYAVGWNSSRLKFYFDGEVKATIDFPLPEGVNANSQVFYNEIPWVIIINLAVSGNYVGGSVPSDAVFTGPVEDRSLMVDWVRVYEE